VNSRPPRFFEQMRGEVTVYNMFCKTQRIQGQCKADEEQTANPQSFKVYPDQQSVIYWIGDSAPTKYSNCAVPDTINWRCTQGRSGEADGVFDGRCHLWRDTGFPVHPQHCHLLSSAPMALVVVEDGRDGLRQALIR
jgi:hypothetical protein